MPLWVVFFSLHHPLASNVDSNFLSASSFYHELQQEVVVCCSYIVFTGAVGILRVANGRRMGEAGHRGTALPLPSPQVFPFTVNPL